MSNNCFRYYFKHDYQEIIIKGFSEFFKSIDTIIQLYLRFSLLKISYQRAYQFLIMIVIQNLFGLTRSKTHSILVSKDALILNKYILNYQE